MNAPVLDAPILMRPDEVICLAEAAHRLRRTDKIARKVCREFRISRQIYPGAPIDVSAPALEMVIHNDHVALELLRNGERHHPRVRLYFDLLGLP